MKKIKKNILIIGGAGFIGKNILGKINKNLYKVYILDKQSEIKKNLKFLNNCNIIRGDISKHITFSKIKIKFFKVFYLAAQSSTFLCEKNKKDCFKSNFIGLTNFYIWAVKNKPSNIVFTSSMAVYGIKANNVRENGIIKPISIYAKSKVFGEDLLITLKQLNINVKIFRLFNVYGPLQDMGNLDQGMLSIYLSQIIKNKMVIVKGSLKRYRDFIFIDDVVKVLIKNFKFNSEDIINVATGKKTTVKDLIILLFKNLNLKVKIKVVSSHIGDSFGTYANIDKLKKINLKPKISLKIGIKKTIKSLYNN